MPHMDKDLLIASLCPPLDGQLCEQLFDEFLSLEKRYALREWEPATLDGGQFSEAAARLVYHRDSRNLNRRKGVNECLKYVEDSDGKNAHHFPERKAALHICRVIRTIYKFRSDRGAVHIDPVYTANHLDSKLVLENGRWVLSEILRVFWTADRAQVAATIRQIIQYDVPAIGVYDGRPIVQRSDCSVEEEILIVLHFAGEDGFDRTQIGKSVMKSSGAITNALKALSSARRREVLKLHNGHFRLTDVGIRRVLRELSEKLIL